MRKWLPAAVLGLVLFGVGSASAAKVRLNWSAVTGGAEFI